MRLVLTLFRSRLLDPGRPLYSGKMPILPLRHAAPAILLVEEMGFDNKKTNSCSSINGQLMDNRLSFFCDSHADFSLHPNVSASAKIQRPTTTKSGDLVASEICFARCRVGNDAKLPVTGAYYCQNNWDTQSRRLRMFINY